MYLIFITVLVQIFTLCLSGAIVRSACDTVCPSDLDDLQCAFDIKSHLYKVFPNECAMKAFSSCHGIELVETPLSYCITGKPHNETDNDRLIRRSYDEEPCPVFCPNHYSPVCGASKIRGYVYRTFNNGCFLDMINCRGDEDLASYVEVPLEFCQNHLMKNIFNEQVVVSNLNNYEDYD